MKNFLFYAPRILAIIIIAIFAIFILEGFSPEFGWMDSFNHLLMALVALGATIIAWKKPKIGCWFFIFFGIWFLWTNFDNRLQNGLIIGGIPLLTGVLFLIEGFKKNK